MACRWLRSECRRYGLEWRSVSAEEFEEARSEAQAHTLFELDRPGFVFFDDFDAAVRDRDPASQHQDQSTFLGGLDGLEVHHGVVYLFTSNARLADLNPAFRRPGRIDLVLAFSRPDADLRRKLIIRWHRDIISALQVDEVVAETEGLSYAEIEEVKKLLVLRQLDTGEWDWRWAWEVYRTGRGTGALRQRIGFTRNGHSERSASSRR
jgi:SpoVK/Ycf46/Vps4 family AAA+-type ATPase